MTLNSDGASLVNLFGFTEWQWHLLGYMQVCTSSKITMPLMVADVCYVKDWATSCSLEALTFYLMLP